MRPGLKAGCVYFVIVFAAGFVLGTVRVLLLVPILGEAGAVLTELPFILVISWLVCRWLIAGAPVPATLSARTVMGVMAFVLLMAAEGALAIFVFGQDVSGYLQSYRSIPAILGLAGQIAFALFPLVQLQMGGNQRIQG